MSHTLTIGEVARRAGLHTSAIRYYEGIGLLPQPQRVSGRRRYDPLVVRRLAAIRTARALGFSLPEIAALLDGFAESTPPAARWEALAERKLPQIEAEIEALTRLKRLLEAGRGCRCPAIEDCLSGGEDASL